MAYEYPYTKVLVQDDVDFVVAANHNTQEVQLFELTEAVKALDDFSALFPTRVGAADKLVAVKNDETGYEYIDAPSGGGGLSEPGLIQYCEPWSLEEASWGFEMFNPAALVTNRALLVTEDIRLRIQEMNGGGPQVIAQPATIGMAYLYGDSYVTEFYFAIQGGWNIAVPLGISFPCKIMARLGVWDTVAGAWVDFITVRVEGLIV